MLNTCRSIAVQSGIGLEKEIRAKDRQRREEGTVMALLEVKDLQVFYGVIQALKGISFEVSQGEIVTLIGPGRERDL